MNCNLSWHGLLRVPRVVGSPDPLRNRVLAALSVAAWGRVEPKIWVVSLQRQQTTNLFEAPMIHVDFPIDAVMSVIATLSNGANVDALGTRTCGVGTARDAGVGADRLPGLDGSL